MNYLLDDVAQILARSTSRRQTLRLLGRALVGTVVGTFWLGVTPAPAGQARCDTDDDCKGKKVCCCKGTPSAKCEGKCKPSPRC
jgi:hypothetical protein